MLKVGSVASGIGSVVLGLVFVLPGFTLLYLSAWRIFVKLQAFGFVWDGVTWLLFTLAGVVLSVIGGLIFWRLMNLSISLSIAWDLKTKGFLDYN